MEEVHINSSALATSDMQVMKSNSENLQQICRRGDKIYKVPDENITMIMEEKNDETKVSIGDASNTQVDEVSSGESLYKTFSFDNNITKEETEKCISFWRSVVEKNLEPIKCSIIENLNNDKNVDGDVPEKKEKKKKYVKKEKKSAKQAEERLKSQKQEGGVWFKILEELQKRRLTQTKLLLEKRCRFCDYITPYECDDIKKEIKDHLEELDQWEPTSKKAGLASGSKISKLTSTSSSIIKDAKRKSLQKTKQSSDDNSLGDNIPPVSEAEEEPLNLTQSRQNNDSLIESVKQASSKFKHVDAIEMKKQKRIYSKWRDNTVKQACGCSHSKCGCNTNPAVTAVESSAPTIITQEYDKSMNKTNESKPDIPDKNKNEAEKSDGTDQTANLLTIKEPSKQDNESRKVKETEEPDGIDQTANLLTIKEPSKQDNESRKVKVASDENTNYKNETNTNQSGSIDSSLNEIFAAPRPARASRKSILKLKSIPDLIPSPTASADSLKKIEYQTRKTADKNVEMPKPPKLTRSLARVDSLEIIKRRTSEWGMTKSRTSFSKVDTDLHPTFDRPARKSVLKFKNESVLKFKTDEEASRERRSPRGSLKLGNRTLSLMLECNCDHSDCDCTNTIKYVGKSSTEVLDSKMPEVPKLGKSVSRVDSLTIIKRRASEWGSKTW